MKWLGKLLCCLLVVTAIQGCEEQEVAAPKDVLTQRVIAKDKIPITVLVKYAFSINAFEQEVEKRFPQIDLVQVGNYTSDRGIVEYSRRLEHDDLPDMVMTWPLDVGESFWSKRLLDLSGMPFSSRYNTSMLNDIARDGKLYYLPGPAQVRGIVYNKTLFKEKGWKVPHDFKSFVDLCRTIEASGMRSLQLGFGNPEVLDTAFVGYSYGETFSSPADAQRLADYNSGEGSFGDQFGVALDTFQTMIDAGIWKRTDLDVTYAERETMLFTRKCAMIEDSVLMARMGNRLTGTKDEFALMPFFNPGSAKDWARLYMVCYIGLNRHLAEPANKTKYDLVLQLMDFISSPAGQTALAADTGAMFSSLTSVSPPDVAEITDLQGALQQGRVAVFPELKNAQQALRQGLAGMLTGARTRDDVIRMVNAQNLNPPTFYNNAVIGTARESFTLMETGHFLTDAMRERTGADVALFLDNGKDGVFNGKGISGRLYKGPQTRDDVNRVLPDLKHGEEGVLQVVGMKGEDLVRTLEHSIVVDADGRGWFYYASGLRMEYAPAAEPGKRIKKLTDSENRPLDPQRVYKIAIMDETVPDEAIQSLQDTGVSMHNLLIDAIRSRDAIGPERDNRFIICQP